MTQLKSDLSCQELLQIIESNPLELSPEQEAHLRRCPTCQEARILWLAQEDSPMPLAPTGYFERLPQRILRKLPPARRQFLPRTWWGWLAAAGLMAAIGGTGFLAGRSQRTPVLEARHESPNGLQEMAPEILQVEAPFSGGDEVLNDLGKLSPEQIQDLQRRLDSNAPKKR